MHDGENTVRAPTTVGALSYPCWLPFIDDVRIALLENPEEAELFRKDKKGALRIGLLASHHSP